MEMKPHDLILLLVQEGEQRRLTARGIQALGYVVDVALERGLSYQQTWYGPWSDLIQSSIAFLMDAGYIEGADLSLREAGRRRLETVREMRADDAKQVEEVLARILEITDDFRDQILVPTAKLVGTGRQQLTTSAVKSLFTDLGVPPDDEEAETVLQLVATIKPGLVEPSPQLPFSLAM